MSLASRFVIKGVEDGKPTGSLLNGVPGHSARLIIDQRQSRFQELDHVRLFAGLRVQGDVKCALRHDRTFRVRDPGPAATGGGSSSSTWVIDAIAQPYRHNAFHRCRIAQASSPYHEVGWPRLIQEMG